MSENKASAQDIKDEVDYFIAEFWRIIKDRRKDKTFGESLDFFIEGRLFNYLFTQHANRCRIMNARWEHNNITERETSQ